MSSEVKRLREDRAGLAKMANDLLSKAAEEKRNLSSEEEAKFDEIHGDVDQLKSQIDRHERQAELDVDLESRIDTAVGREDTPEVRDTAKVQVATAEDRNQALRGWVMAGTPEGVSETQRDAAIKCGVNLGSNELGFKLNRNAPKNIREYRAAMSTTDNTAGGFAIPTGFVPTIETALLQFSGMREVATIIRTESGNDLPFVTVNDTGNTGELLAENTAVAEQHVVTGQVILAGWKYSSKVVKASIELLQDQAVDLESYLGARLGERIGRILNTHLTIGSGSSQPNGLVTGATSGVTAASGTAVTYAELIDLKHSVDPAYRGNATWMFSDATLAALKKLVDGDSRPLWNAGIANGEPDRLDGDLFVVNNDVLDMASSAKSIIYGDLSKYIIRDVAGMTLLRLNERYADVGQVGFIAFSRHDGDSLDATAYKCITMA